MKNSKEHKISFTLFCIALVLYAISFVTGLIPELNTSIDKICMSLGFAFFGFGLVYFKKSENSDKR